MNKNSTEIQKKLLAPYKDLLVISIVAVLTLILAVYFDWLRIFYKWHIYLEKYKLDEIITVLIVLAFAFGIFSIRRWKELKNEIAKSQSQEAEIRLFAQTVVSAKDCISITDLDDNIIFVNDAFVNEYGYTNEELVSKNISIVRAPSTSPELAQQILPATLTGEWHGEMINHRKDGSDFPIELWASLVKNEEGKPVAMVGVARDITERKHAEEILRRKEQHQALLLQSLPMVFYTGRTSADMTTTWISEQVEQITGFLPKQFTADTMFWQNRLHPDDREQVLEKYLSVFKEGYIQTEYRWQCANGSYRWFSDQIVLIRDEQGKPKETVGIWIDITERKKMETALLNSREDLSRLLNSIAEGAYGVDTNGNCTFVNRAFLQILGYQNEQEVLGKNIHELIHHSHNDRSLYPASECRIYDAYHTKQPIIISDEVFWSKNGGAIPVEYRAHPIVKDGVVIGAITTFTDITERKKAETERENIIGELQQALDNVKTLSGLIPICASCKKIRDDKGYWNQLEHYIIEHSGAKFTHGICPECTEKYYGSFKR
jgi:PAS domain S-box-containing protein